MIDLFRNGCGISFKLWYEGEIVEFSLAVVTEHWFGNEGFRYIYINEEKQLYIDNGNIGITQFATSFGVEPYCIKPMDIKFNEKHRVVETSIDNIVAENVKEMERRDSRKKEV